MSFRVRIALAVGCAVVAGVLMAVYAASVRGTASEQRRSALEQYGGETVTVCVAARDIAQGETFSERNVEAVEWLVDLLPEGALVEIEDLMGKTAASAIAANTPVASVDVDAQGASLDVPAGMVAVSVPCSNESAVGGALSSGSTVDVYVVSGDAARLLCQGVQVLATNAEGTAASLSWVTLGVDPAEVEALIAASSLQRLYFVLPSDEEVERRLTEASSDGGAEEAGGLAAYEGGGVEPAVVEGASGEDAAEGGLAAEGEAGGTVDEGGRPSEEGTGADVGEAAPEV